jgi:hypothetical protein
MRVAQSGSRLCFTRAWPCKTTSSVLASIAGSNTSCISQRRILLTVASRSPTQHIPTKRSPYQWVHIAHRIRHPFALSVSPFMATDFKVNGVQIREHAGHSHGHHHHHDNTYLTSGNKSDPGVRITRVGLYVNLGMAIAKGAGGYIFNSKA